MELGELGVQVAAYRGEELVADEWIGTADPETGRPVDGDTLFPVIAVTKAVTLTALHLQADRGLVDYQAAVAEYWPEFGCHGKQAVTVAHVLEHRPGIVTPDLSPEELVDWDRVVEALAASQLLYEPGARSIYSGYVQGFILGEVVRRTDPARRPLGVFVRQEITAPIGAGDLWLGLPPDQEGRVARLVSAPSLAAGQTPQANLRRRAVPPSLLPTADLYNRPQMHQACVPPSGGIMSARAGARLFALLANGGCTGGHRVLSEATIRACTVPRPDPGERTADSGVATWIGTGGYWLGGGPCSDPLFGTGRHTIGIGGQWRVGSGETPARSAYLCSGGGSIGWADTDTGLAVAIFHNRLSGQLAPDRHPFTAIADAVRARMT